MQADTKQQQPIRATAIKAGMLSMAHMRLAMTDSAAKDSPAMRWGRLVHMAILEPIKLTTLPRWSGGRKGGKAWDAFAESLDGKRDYLCDDEIADLEAITASAQRALSHLPAVGYTEHRIEWTDDAYGAATARVDAVLRGGGLLDVKTCANIASRAFLAQGYRLGYHLQMGWYAHGLATRGVIGPVWVLAIESAAPWTWAIYRVSPSRLDVGYAEARMIAMKYRACELLGVFPGPYDDDVLDYDFPAWAGGGSDETDISKGEMEASEL